MLYIRKFLIFSAIVIVFSLALLSCTTVKLVQPYDEALIDGVQGFYKESATFLDEAKVKSPEVRPSSSDENNSGHLSHFESGYDRLVIDANLLIMRAMVNSIKLSEIGVEAQNSVSNFIDENLPSACVGNSANLGAGFTSLTVKNFADLKCIITNWKVQHTQAPGQIMTKGDWERRHRTLINAIISIQQAENFKQVEKTL